MKFSFSCLSDSQIFAVCQRTAACSRWQLELHLPFCPQGVVLANLNLGTCHCPRDFHRNAALGPHSVFQIILTSWSHPVIARPNLQTWKALSLKRAPMVASALALCAALINRRGCLALFLPLHLLILSSGQFWREWIFSLRCRTSVVPSGSVLISRMIFPMSAEYPCSRVLMLTPAPCVSGHLAWSN